MCVSSSPFFDCFAVLLLLSTIGMSSKKMSGSSSLSPPLNSFQWLNKNCYRTYTTEQGLCQHFWQNESCKNYMLSGNHTLTSSSQDPYNANLMGFDFSPRATTRKVNVNWMYNALCHSHQSLPQVIRVELEDHDNVQYVVSLSIIATCHWKKQQWNGGAKHARWC